MFLRWPLHLKLEKANRLSAYMLFVFEEISLKHILECQDHNLAGVSKVIFLDNVS